MNIPRYNPVIEFPKEENNYEYVNVMLQCPEGDFVKYETAKSMIERRDSSIRMLVNLIQRLNEETNQIKRSMNS